MSNYRNGEKSGLWVADLPRAMVITEEVVEALQGACDFLIVFHDNPNAGSDAFVQEF